MRNASPTYLEFENWAAGDTVAGKTHEKNGGIYVGYARGEKRKVADVVQRVQGTGRFGGTEFAHIGQMDTNHPGALTFSTSPFVGFSWDENVRGGFQIVPANHVKFLSNDLGQNSFIGSAPSGSSSARSAPTRSGCSTGATSSTARPRSPPAGRRSRRCSACTPGPRSTRPISASPPTSRSPTTTARPGS
ncbi:hypothetical protein ACFSTC_10395 [Nonomuraea ferruginea]